jgi:hypothetical protein
MAISRKSVDTILQDYSGWPLGGETAELDATNTATNQTVTFVGRDAIRDFWDGFFSTGYTLSDCPSKPLDVKIHEHGFWIVWQCPKHGIAVGSDSVALDGDNLIKTQAVYLQWPGMDLQTWKSVANGQTSKSVPTDVGWIVATICLAPFTFLGLVAVVMKVRQILRRKRGDGTTGYNDMSL